MQGTFKLAKATSLFCNLSFNVIPSFPM